MKKRTPVLLILLSLLLLTAAVTPVLAMEYTGRVVGVHDGDTLTLLAPDKQPIRVVSCQVV